MVNDFGALNIDAELIAAKRGNQYWPMAVSAVPVAMI